MESADPQLSAGSNARLLLSGRLPPEDFAHLAIPAPRALQAVKVTQSDRLLAPAYGLVGAMLAVVGIFAIVLVSTGRGSLHFIGLTYVLLVTVVWLVARVAGARVIEDCRPRSVATPGIDNSYRSLYHAEFLQHLELEIAHFREAQPPDSAFIQDVVKGIQQTLYHVGVPNPQVCIMRSEERGEYVSYYAGYEQPSIEQGAVISDLSSITSRRIVHSQPCSLGLDALHHLTVVATCSSLCDADRKLVEDATKLLSAACRKKVVGAEVLAS